MPGLHPGMDPPVQQAEDVSRGALAFASTSEGKCGLLFCAITDNFRKSAFRVNFIHYVLLSRLLLTCNRAMLFNALCRAKFFIEDAAYIW